MEAGYDNGRGGNGEKEKAHTHTYTHDIKNVITLSEWFKQRPRIHPLDSASVKVGFLLILITFVTCLVPLGSLTFT